MEIKFTENLISIKGYAMSKLNTEIKRGIYEHYKKKYYEVIDIARHSETLEYMVVYRMLAEDFGLWVRPANMFAEQVEINGEIIPRFKFITAQNSNDWFCRISTDAMTCPPEGTPPHFTTTY